MPKTMEQVHEEGHHRAHPRPRCPLCRADVEACRRALARFGGGASFETETPPSADPDMMVACDVFEIAAGVMFWQGGRQRWRWTLTDKGRKAMGG